MAIKRRIQTRTTTKDAPEVVSIYDSAIDEEKSDLAAYANTRDLKHLVAKPGEDFTVFKVRPLERVEFRRVSHDAIAEATREDDRLSQPAYRASMKTIAFRRGCLEVQGIENDKGETETQTGAQAYTWLDDAFLYDIGGYIIEISTFGAPEPEKDVGK